jgi:hypothetical protein
VAWGERRKILSPSTPKKIIHKAKTRMLTVQRPSGRWLIFEKKKHEGTTGMVECNSEISIASAKRHCNTHCKTYGIFCPPAGWCWDTHNAETDRKKKNMPHQKEIKNIKQKIKHAIKL